MASRKKNCFLKETAIELVDSAISGLSASKISFLIDVEILKDFSASLYCSIPISISPRFSIKVAVISFFKPNSFSEI